MLAMNPALGGFSTRSLRILCGREVQISIQDSVKRLLDDKIDYYGVRWFFKSTQTDIIGQNGSRIFFKGLRTDPHSVKSTEGIDIVWIEEANTVSQTSLDLLKPTVRRKGSQLWFSWNPRYEKDPVDKMLRKEAPPGAIVRQVDWRHNPWFDETRMPEEMEWDRRRDPDKYAHIWLGQYLRNSEARVFRNWREESFETPTTARFYYGADWGFSVDPTVLIRCFIQDRTLFVDQEVYQIGCDIDHTPALFAGSDTKQPARWQNPRNFPGVEGSNRWPIYADSARPETISYMAKRGFNIMPARKGPGSVEDGIEFLKNFDIIVHPRCRHTIDELTMYCYKVDKLTDDVLPELDDKHNHVIDALRYAVEARRRSINVVTPVVVTSSRDYFEPDPTWR